MDVPYEDLNGIENQNINIERNISKFPLYINKEVW